MSGWVDDKILQLLCRKWWCCSYAISFYPSRLSLTLQCYLFSLLFSPLPCYPLSSLYYLSPLLFTSLLTSQCPVRYINLCPTSPHTHIYTHAQTQSHTLPTHPPHTGTIYGMGPALAAAKLGIDVASANRITHSFFNNYKQMKSWMMTIKRRVFFSLICNQIWSKCSYGFFSIIKK